MFDLSEEILIKRLRLYNSSKSGKVWDSVRLIEDVENGLYKVEFKGGSMKVWNLYSVNSSKDLSIDKFEKCIDSLGI